MNLARPKSLTLVALLPAWLSLGGFAIAIWASAITPRSAAQATFIVVGTWYAVSALGAAAGLWRVRAWALPFLTSWGVATLVAGWLPQLVVHNQPPLAPGIGATLQLLVVVLPLWFFVRRRLPPPSRDSQHAA